MFSLVQSAKLPQELPTSDPTALAPIKAKIRRLFIDNWRLAAGAGLSILSAILAMLATPPYSLWPLIFLAYVPMIVAQHRILPPRWSLIAPGITFALWFASQLLEGLVEANVPFIFQLLPLYAGLVAAAFSWRSRRFHEETGYRCFFVVTPVAWVAIDFVRGYEVAMLAGTWGNPVYALWAQAWLLQPVSLVGTYGLELLLLCVNWVIAGLIISVLDTRGAFVQPICRRHAIRAAGWVGMAIGVWVIVSILLFSTEPATLRVAAVQPGPTRDAEEELHYDMEQTRMSATGGARLVVWREAGVLFDPRSERTDEFAALARETGVYLVVGFWDALPDGRHLNMAAVFSPDGSLLGSYGKDHPGTFAGDLSDLQEGYPVWETAIGNLAAIICYDLDFTDTARFMARSKAQIVAVPSNDSVPFLAETHYTHLVFRAIENRVSLIKADKMRDAAAVDPWGRVVARVVDRRGQRSTLIADLPLGKHNTLLVKLGDWVGWLCLFALTTILVVSAGWRFRRRWARTASIDRTT